MKKRFGIIEGLAVFMLASLPVHGAPLTPDGSTATTLDTAPNGVPVVNLANPNASGLSHNRFTEYNVNPNGLILNNARDTAVQTQLGGYIAGNAGLTHNATLILNEVTSTSQTQLKGFTEIAGPRADLVIANPNGLLINGAGFINTHRVTLTTGRPVTVEGVLQSLNVRGGVITIQGAGLNTQDQSSTALYTQYLHLNARLHAQNLDIALGGNSVDYQTGTVVANTATNARTVLLDASALGGMYANRITLVGTDKGLGVNLPPEVLASSGDIRIDNDGTIVLQKISASDALAVTSGSADITVGQSAYGGVTAGLNAAGALTVDAGARVVAGKAVTARAATLTNRGSIVAGLGASGEQQPGGAVSLTANTLSNGGDIQSTGSMSIAVANGFNNTARIVALGDITVQADALDNRNGQIQASGDVNLNTATVTFTDSTLSAGKSLSLTTGSLVNAASSIISAGGELVADVAGTAVNDGDLLAGGSLNLTVGGALRNTQMISAKGSLQLDAAQLDNAGIISGGNGASRVTVTGNINNGSRMSAVGDLDVSSGADISNDGVFNAGNNLSLTSINLTNRQTLFAGNDLNLTLAGALNNAASSTVSAGGELVADVAGTAVNDGDLLAGGRLNLTVGGALRNTQMISAKGSLQLDAAQLDNAGIISGGNGASRVTVTGNINNGSRISAVGDLDVSSGADISNDGVFNAGNNLSLTSINLTNRQTLFAGNDMNLIVSGMLMNDALTNMASSISAEGNLFAQVSGDVVNKGDLLVGGKLRLNVGDVLINTTTISAGGSLHLDTTRLNNAGTISGGSGTSTISVTGNIDNGSRISAAGDLDVISGATIVNSGFFNTGNNLTISARNLANRQTLFAGNNMNLYITDTLLNNPNANIFAINNLTLAADAGRGKSVEIINNRANIETFQGDINVYATRLVNRTDAPVVRGTYVPGDRDRIDGGQQLSVQTTTEYCAGHNCKNMTTTTVDTMVLLSKSAPATLNAGRNLSLYADNISNQYSLMSAGENVHLAAAVVDNQPVNIAEVTTVSTKKYRDKHSCKVRFGKCFGRQHKQKLTGTETTASNQVVDTIASTIQAGGSISGNVANLINGNIQAGQKTVTGPAAQTQNTATAPTLQTQNISTASVLQTQDATTAPVTGILPTLTLPTGDTGLFVVSPDPQSQYLVVTNPAFTSLNAFQSSAYLLDRIGYSPDRTVKLLGDALYENRLIRDAIFVQTGRRFLRPDITSDAAQYHYLMDNALALQEGLQLIPGVALSSGQVALLERDIVWLVEQEVAGQRVLVPVVYTRSLHDFGTEGGKIIAAGDLVMHVDDVQNAGLIEAGGNLSLQAADSIVNQNGSLRAGSDLTLSAGNTIENISGSIRANNISLESSNGDIINRRYTQTQNNSSGSTRDVKTVVGVAGEIVATESLTLTANQQITVAGSALRGESISLDAQTVTLGTTVLSSDFSASGGDASIKRQSTTHLGSTLDGGNIAINTRGTTTVAGSRITAEGNLSIDAADIEILAVNDSSFSQESNSSSGFLSKKSTTTTLAKSINIGSSLSAGNITLRTTEGDITVAGSGIAANETLALDSAGNIALLAGYDGEMNETIKKKSGFFSGGSLYSSSTDIEGELSKTAVLSSLSGENVSLNAAQDMTLAGVAISATESLDGSAQNIIVANATDEKTTWSKYEELSIGIGDTLKALTNPMDAITVENGKASLRLATANISQADETTTTSTVVSSSLAAGNINFTATSDAPDGGNIQIIGTDLFAENAITLNADNNVSIEAAQNTEQTTRREMEGTAELRLTAQNEYVQIGYALEAAQASKDNLAQVKKDYRQYQDDVDTQQANLRQRQTDLASGRVGIEQVDIDEMQNLIDDLKQDDAFYQTNIALASADLVSKTLAVASQMATAAQSSGTYGFSAALALDLNGLEQQFAATQEQSVASSLSANTISITAGNTATVQGSDLNAAERIDISAQNTRILAAQAVSTSSNSTENRQMSVRYSTSGGISSSASASNSQSNRRSLTQRNSQLVANNIRITTADTTTLAGANLSATEQLRIDTHRLEVASVQNSASRRSNSQGVSASGSMSGLSGAGGNASMSRSNSRNTVLTTLTGNRVGISVAEGTTLRGALIAAVDSEGNDNGQLTFRTGTLTVSSLSNVSSSRATSLGLNVGIANQQQRDQANSSSASSIGLDASRARSNRKSNTLATLGSGDLQIANTDASNKVNGEAREGALGYITLLNRKRSVNPI